MCAVIRYSVHMQCAVIRYSVRMQCAVIRYSVHMQYALRMFDLQSLVHNYSLSVFMICCAVCLGEITPHVLF